MKLKSIALILMTVALPAMAEKVSVNTKGMSLILDVENGKPAQYLYFGTKLNPNDLQNLKVATDGRMDAYPAYGLILQLKRRLPCVIVMAIFQLHSCLRAVM